MGRERVRMFSWPSAPQQIRTGDKVYLQQDREIYILLHCSLKLNNYKGYSSQVWQFNPYFFYSIQWELTFLKTNGERESENDRLAFCSTTNQDRRQGVPATGQGDIHFVTLFTEIKQL
jgi:hypothetical protein